jgi:hypothetical protein
MQVTWRDAKMSKSKSFLDGYFYLQIKFTCHENADLLSLYRNRYLRIVGKNSILLLKGLDFWRDWRKKEKEWNINQFLFLYFLNRRRPKKFPFFLEFISILICTRKKYSIQSHPVKLMSRHNKEKDLHHFLISKNAPVLF